MMKYFKIIATHAHTHNDTPLPATVVPETLCHHFILSTVKVHENKMEMRY